MFQSVDLYLGIFLVVSGVAIALLNLRSILKNKGKFSQVLLSQNIILMCIGLTFLCRAIFSLNPANMNMDEFQKRMIALETTKLPCGFSTLLLSYGPFILSIVNSFLSLVVDNYMHYQIVKEEKIQDNEENLEERNIKTDVIRCFKLNSNKVAIVIQWVLPIITALMLYPMNVQEVPMNQMRNLHDSCISLLDVADKDCALNNTLPIHKYIQTPNVTETLDFEYNQNKTKQIDLVLKNVFNILNNYNNNTDFLYTEPKLVRTPKSEDCMKICVINNKNILIYMFVLTSLCFFAPITISLVILTKIHAMDVKKGVVKKYVTRDILYSVLCWSPAMFDIFLTLVLCSFSMNSSKTSFFNIIGNLYQAVKNFMNTKHFHDNVIVPV